MDDQPFLDVAIAAARAGGRHALENRNRTREVHQAFRHDVKLQLDLECQARVVDLILSHYPDHSILAEEDDAAASATLPGGRRGTAAGGNAGVPEWVVDPIDGTVNFFHGLPHWCCSVAVRVDGKSVAGAVYAPELNELYTATVTGPATVNGTIMAVSDVREASEAMMLTGINQKEGPSATPFAVLERLTHGLQKLRVMGSATLDICRVARGQADAYWEPAIYLWDMSAAGLIVERAGGQSEILKQDGKRVSFLATNGHVHAAVRRLLLA